MKTLYTVILSIFISLQIIGQEIKPAIQKSHASPITEINFLEANHLSSFSKDGNAVLWDLKYEKVIEFTTGADEAGSFGFKNENISNSKHLEYMGRKSKVGGELKNYIYQSENYLALVKKNKIRFYKSGKMLFSTLIENGAYISHVAHSPKHQLVFVGCEDGTIKVLKERSGRLQMKLNDHNASITSFMLDEDEKLLASGSADRSIIIWEIPEMKLQKRLSGKTFNPVTLKFSPDGNSLFIGDELGTFRKFDFNQTLPQMSSISLFDQAVDDFLLSEDLVYAFGGNNRVSKFSWKLEDQKQRSVIKNIRAPNLKYRINRFFQGYMPPMSYINSTAISPSGDYFAMHGGLYSREENLDGTISTYKTSTNLMIFDKELKLIKKLPLRNPEISFISNDEIIFIKNEGNESKSLKYYFSPTMYQNSSAVGVFLVKCNCRTGAETVWEKTEGVSSFAVLSNNQILLQKKGEWFIFNPETQKEIAIELNLNGNISIKNGFVVNKTSTDLKFYKLIDNQLKFQFKIDAEKITDFDIHPDKKIIAFTDTRGFIGFYDIEKSQQQASLVPVKEKGFMVFDNENNYYITKDAIGFNGFSYNDRFIYPYQFDKFFNRPDIVFDKMGVIDNEFVKLYQTSVKRRGDIIDRSKLKLANLPELEITTYQSGQKDMVVQLHIQNAGENGKLITTINGVQFSEIDFEKPESSFDFNITVPLVNGNNEITFGYLREGSLESVHKTILHESTFTQPSNLYIVAMGVSEYEQKDFNLTYAAKDAHDMIDALKNYSEDIYENIETMLLTNEEVTQEALENVKLFLKDVQPNDVVIFFAAGHGVLDNDLNYYFGSHDMDFYNPENDGISFKMLEEILLGVKAIRKTLILDTCHSGEVDEENLAEAEPQEVSGVIKFRSVNSKYKSKAEVSTLELSKQLFSDINNTSGANIIASASGGEFAIESGGVENGLFTYALIRGLEKNRADLDGNKEIWLNELREYAYKQVVEQSNGQQSPTARSENLLGNIRLK
jgi:WD40 repeat protein/uncharacterized caspase-like protein